MTFIQPTKIAYLHLPTFTVCSKIENLFDEKSCARLLFPYDAKKLTDKKIALDIIYKYVHGSIWTAELYTFFCSKNLPPLLAGLLDTINDQFYKNLNARLASIFVQPLKNSSDAPVTEDVFVKLTRTMEYFAQNYPFKDRCITFEFNPSVEYASYISQKSNYIPSIHQIRKLETLTMVKTYQPILNVILETLSQTTPNSLSVLAINDNLDKESLDYISEILANPHCSMRMLVIRFSCEEWHKFAVAFSKNKSLQKLCIKANTDCALNFIPFCLANDNISSCDFLVEDSNVERCDIYSYIATYNTFIRGKRFVDYCLNFFTLHVPPYVLLEIMYFAFPGCGMHINEELRKKLHRLVIPRIESIYHSFTAVKRRRLQ